MQEAQRLMHSSSTRNTPFATLADTMHALLLKKNTAEAQKLRAFCNMSDGHYDHIRCAALASMRDWDGLLSLAGKKPPINALTFVSMCQKFGCPSQILARFVERVGDVKVRAHLFSQSGLQAEASAANEEAASAGRFPFFNSKR